MKVFISYSAKDTAFVRRIAEGIRAEHVTVNWWGESKRLGEDSWKQIFGWIDEAEFVLAIVTGNVLHRGLAVGNEIGYARAKGKTIIPLVTDEKDRFDLGCLIGAVDQYIDQDDPQAGIEAIKRHIQKEHLLSVPASNEKPQIQKVPPVSVPAPNGEVDWGKVLMILGVVGVIWVAAKE